MGTRRVVDQGALPGVSDVVLGPGARLLRGFAGPVAAYLVADVAVVAARAPFRGLVTPGGRPMRVEVTNCGALGWLSSAQGYGYVRRDPATGAAWPALPARWSALARAAAAAAGFGDFVPDACLVNRYAPGAGLGLHQDLDEPDRAAPIVSVSLGLPATFLWGGRCRTDAVARVALAHGDVVVFGGPDRLRYHGVAPVAAGDHPATGPCRINLTLRRAGG